MLIIKKVIIYLFKSMSKLFSICPVCDAQVVLAEGVEESEIISCSDCRCRLVVEKIEKNTAALTKAPEVEEDWGE